MGYPRKTKHRSAAGAAGCALALLLVPGASCTGSSTNSKLGVGKEGDPCNAAHACNSSLRCVASLFTVNVCGRACADASDCSKGERCYSYSDLPADGHCVDIVTDEYAECGVSKTSLCADGRSCLYLPQQAYGLCVSTCALDRSQVDAMVDEDAGVVSVDAGAASADGGMSSRTPDGAVACAAEQACVDQVLAEPDPNEGVCGKVAARGESCGIEQGIYCRSGIDICAPKDPNDLSSDQQCFQDCSDAKTHCDSGKCVNVQDLFAYCQ